MVEVRLPVVPRDASPLATGLGGAGAAVGGFMQAEAFAQQNALRQQEAAMQQQALDQRGQQIELANRRQDAIAQRYLSEREAKANEARQEQQQRGDVFGVLRSIYGLDGAQASTQPADPMGGMPQEWAQEIDTIGRGFRSGALTASQATDALKLVASNKEATLRRLATQQLTKRITDEIGAGVWSPENALGLQMDVDGDGQPDPVSETPQLLLRALGEGKLAPEQVEAMHFRAKQAINDEKARIVTRETEALRAEQALQALPGLTPEGRRLAMGRIAAWRADEYPQTKQGMEQFQRDLGAAQAGLVPIKKNGTTLYVNEAEAKDAAFSINPPATPDQIIEQRSNVLARLLGEYKDDPELDDAENDKRWQRHRARMQELNAELFGGVSPAATGASGSMMAIKEPEQQRPSASVQERRAWVLEQLGGRDYMTLSEAEKAELARRERAQFPRPSREDVK